MANLWRIKVWESPTASIDLTSYVQSVSIQHSADLGRCGRSSATVVLDNSSGIFTPNGSGLYASKDWFETALVVENTTSGQQCFNGMPQTFEISNDSIYESTVTLTAVDILTIAGRSPATTSFSTTILSSYADQALGFFFNGYTSGGTVYYSGVDMPYIGATNESNLSVSCATDSSTTVTNDDFPPGRVGDWINNNLMISGPCTAMAVKILNEYPTTNRFRWEVYFIDRSLNKTSGYANDVSFSQQDGSFATATDLPFTDIDLGYNFDQIINSCTAADQRSIYTSTTVTDSASTAKYGVRNVQFNSTCTEQQADVDRVANFWPNRYSGSSFTVRSLTTSQSASSSAGSSTAKFVDLCDPGLTMWSRAKVRYKTAGMSSAQTIIQVVNGLTINITPSDTVVTVDLLVGVDNQSFELDSTTFGILDTNRLG